MKTEKMCLCQPTTIRPPVMEIVIGLLLLYGWVFSRTANSSDFVGITNIIVNAQSYNNSSNINFFICEDKLDYCLT